MKKTLTYLAAFCVIALISNVGSAAWLSDNQYATGFENPPFPAETYIGLDYAGEGWTSESAAPAHGFHVTGGGAYEGTQLLQIKNTVVNKNQVGRHTLDAFTGAGLEVYLNFSIISHWDWTNNADNIMEFYLEGGAGESINFFGIRGATGSEIRLRDGSGWFTVPGYTVNKGTGTPSDSSLYTHFSFMIDPTNATYDVSINGDDLYTDLGLNEFYANGLQAIAVVSPANEMIQGVAMDNFSWGAVPEPVTLSILAIGGLAGMLRRRR